eukprot:gene17397-23697_t
MVTTRSIGQHRAFMLLEVLLAAVLSVATAQETVQGQVFQHGYHTPRAVDRDEYYLHQEGTKEQLDQMFFPVPPPKDLLLTGYTITADTADGDSNRRLRRLLQGGGSQEQSGNNNSGGNGMFLINPASITVQNQGSERDYTAINGTVNISTIVFIINVQGQGYANIDIQKFKGTWLNKYNAKGADNTESMENYFKDCSYGKMQFGENNEVVDLTDIVMPATGVTPYTRWNYNMARCDGAELYGVQEWARQQFEARGGDISKYVRRVVLMPNPQPSTCPWYGLGNQGCYGSYCYNWIRGDRGNALQTFFHELGHTINLQHSSTTAWEYGDCSCAMGCSGNNGCYNAPTSQRAGWSVPIATLTGANLSTGDRKLSIHQYNGTSIYDLAMPLLVGSAGLNLGRVFNDTNTGLTVKFTAAGPTSAQIELCRYTTTVETNCNDGKDDDCNGLIDLDDPACKNYVETCGNGNCGIGENANTCPQDCKAPGVTPPFCMDYGTARSLCECSNGPSPSQSFNGYNSYNVSCTGDIVPPNVSIYGITSVQLCAEWCIANSANSANTRPFCFDYRSSNLHCECAGGASPSQPSKGYVSYTYDCSTANPSPYPTVSPSPSPPPPASTGECSYTLVAKETWCSNPSTQPGDHAEITSADITMPGQSRRLNSLFGFELDEFNGQVFSTDGATAPSAVGRQLMDSMSADPGDIVIPRIESYHTELDEEVMEAMSRHLLANPKDSHKLAHTRVESAAACGDGVCSPGENHFNCAKDCCAATSCGDGICQAFAVLERSISAAPMIAALSTAAEMASTMPLHVGNKLMSNCPEDCVGDLDGKHGAPFCCGAYIGCSHDDRCTGTLLSSGVESTCITQC